MRRTCSRARDPRGRLPRPAGADRANFISLSLSIYIYIYMCIYLSLSISLPIYL